jgi:hypothetical protein
MYPVRPSREEVSRARRGRAGSTAGYLSRTPDLAEHPEAEIELNGRKVAVTAAQLSGDVREAAWQKVITASPLYIGYGTKSDRVMAHRQLTADIHPPIGCA